MKNEENVARKIVAVLEADLDTLDTSTTARLQAARQQAVAAMAPPQHAAVENPVLAGWGQVVDFSHHGGYRFWLPVMLLLAILMTMMGSMTSLTNEPIDTDAMLLASDLPPEAVADKEFVAWLENSSHL